MVELSVFLNTARIDFGHRMEIFFYFANDQYINQKDVQNPVAVVIIEGATTVAMAVTGVVVVYTWENQLHLRVLCL